MRLLISGGGSRREGIAQLRAGADFELGEDPVEVRADRAVREEQALGDLTVREALRRELGDLQLLCGEPVTRVGRATADLLARRAELLPSVPAPTRRTQEIEDVDRLPQVNA